MTQLTQRQAKFVASYAGNGVEACRAAGYKGDDNALAVMASKLLRIAHVAAAIRARESKVLAPLIATRQERQKFWSDVMQGREEAGLNDRLRASELLGKSEADFTEKVQADVAMKVSISINGIQKGKP